MPIINPTVRLYAAPVEPKVAASPLPGIVAILSIVGVLGYWAYRDDEEERARPKTRGIETREDFERFMNT